MTIPSGDSQHSRPYTPKSSMRRGKARTFRNRSLVLKKEPLGETTLSDRPDIWVSSRRGNMTLMTPAVYEASQATQLERARKLMILRKHAQLKAKEAKEAEALRYLAQTTLEHLGGVYRINKAAKLLIRLGMFSCDLANQKDLETIKDNPTPSSTTINGVVFVKSPKTNNLYRKTSVRLNANSSERQKSSKRFCKHYTRTGVCPRGARCRYQHSPDQLALCPYYLSKRGCSRGSGCVLSHNATPNNAPTCAHFLQGACTTEACKFSHIYTNPAADICLAFQRTGYCSVGAQCPLRHSRDCADGSDATKCRNSGCRVHRAQHSTTFRPSESTSIEAELDPVSSDSEISSDDYEEEDFDANTFGDFVKL